MATKNELVQTWESIKTNYPNKIILLRDKDKVFTFKKDAATLMQILQGTEFECNNSNKDTFAVAFRWVEADKICTIITRKGYDPILLGDSNTKKRTTKRTTKKATNEQPKQQQTIQEPMNTTTKTTSRAALKSLCSQLQAAAKQAGVAKTINTLLREHYQISGEVHTYDEWKAAGAAVKKGAKAYAFWGNPVTTSNGNTFYPIRYVFTTSQVYKAQ